MLSVTDRKIAPPHNDIKHVDIIKAREEKLDNGLPVFLIDAGDQEVVKIDFIFNAGYWQQKSNLIASLTNAMLYEGTDKMNAAQIAEIYDFHGSYIQFAVDQHHGRISLITLNRHLNRLLETTEGLIKHSVIPEHDLQSAILKRKNRYIVDSQKVNFICQKQFSNVVFGNHHPYASTAEAYHFDQVERQHLIDFYQHHYCANNCYIIVAGKTGTQLTGLLNNYFGQNDWLSKEKYVFPDYTISPSNELIHHTPKTDALQTAVRTGCPAINKLHPDYPGLSVVNTILGGYFGSRLMRNIREEKGYTYGVYSILSSYQKGGCFFISSEVGNDVAEPAIAEIRKELKRLREEPVADTELKLVSNYMLGEILRELDGPFALSSLFKGLYDYGLDYSFIDRKIDAIKTITPEQIIELSNRYLHEDRMFVVTAGAK